MIGYQRPVSGNASDPRALNHRLGTPCPTVRWACDWLCVRHQGRERSEGYGVPGLPTFNWFLAMIRSHW